MSLRRDRESAVVVTGGIQRVSTMIGGIRASIYNAFPQEGVDALIAFMQGFE